MRKKKDEKGNIVDAVKKRAFCKFCPRGKVGDFAIKSRGGTSGMLRHINHGCRYITCVGDHGCRYITRVGDKSQKLLMGISLR